jgi:hypothetical protein
MIGDLLEHAAEVEFRIESVQLGCSQQRIDGSGTFSAGVGR